MTTLDRGIFHAIGISTPFWLAVMAFGIGFALILAVAVYCCVVLAARVDENSQHLQGNTGYGAGSDGEAH